MGSLCFMMYSYVWCTFTVTNILWGLLCFSKLLSLSCDEAIVDHVVIRASHSDPSSAYELWDDDRCLVLTVSLIFHLEI